MTETKAPALETPEEVAERCYDDGDFDNMIAAIREDRRAIAAWCEQKAEEAQREADAHALQVDSIRAGLVSGADIDGKRNRMHRCEGQASFARAIAALLRGGQ